ncbi:MAG: hypothetical protein ABJA78_11500 [Ferruginibacter sp.]
MNKYKIIIAITVLLLLANTVLLGLLWFGKKQPPPPPNPGPAMVENLLKEKLSLTDDEIKQFRVLRDEHFNLNKKLNDSLHLQKDILFSMLGKIESNNVKVDSMTGIIGNLEKQKDVNTFNHFSKVRLILTATQQEKFDKVINDVLRMIAGPQPGNHMPPPPRGERPPPPGDHEMPPPGEGPPPERGKQEHPE